MGILSMLFELMLLLVLRLFVSLCLVLLILVISLITSLKSVLSLQEVHLLFWRNLQNLFKGMLVV